MDVPKPHRVLCSLAGGVPQVKCDAHYSGAYGVYPWSIVRTTRQGVKYYTATWLPTGCHQMFNTKREATKFAKHHFDGVCPNNKA